MATRERLEEDLSFDVGRIPLPETDVKASDDALAVLDELQGEHPTVEQAIAYARSEGPQGRPKTNDLLRTLAHADGRLALVTWSSGGIDAVGYLPDQQRYDVAGYSAVKERMGKPCEYHEIVSKEKAKDVLQWSKPDVVRREESQLLPALDDVRGVPR